MQKNKRTTDGFRQPSLCVAAFVAFVAAVVLPGHVLARDLAVVIANGEYRNLLPRPTSQADADSVASLLKGFGYRVVARRNQTAAEMRALFNEVNRALSPGDTLVVFYAGHGWNDGTVNYAVGVDAPRQASVEQSREASVPLIGGGKGAIDALARKRLKLMAGIIEASSDDPFRRPGNRLSVSGNWGMTGVAPPANSFIVFSAGKGAISYDGLRPGDPSPNGVFTRVLAPLLKDGATLRDAAKRATADVPAMTRNMRQVQMPMIFDTTRGDTCLGKSCRPLAPHTMPGTGTTRAKLPPSGSGSQGSLTAAEKAFRSAESVNTLAVWDAFLARHAYGPLANRARTARAKLARQSPGASPQTSPGSRPPRVASHPTGGTSKLPPSTRTQPTAPVDIAAGIKVADFIILNVLPTHWAYASDVRQLYANTVDYFDKGRVPVSTVVADKVKYGERWDAIEYSLVPRTFSIRQSAARDAYDVVYQVTFRVGHLDEMEAGVAENRMTVNLAGPTPVITAETSRVLKRGEAAADAAVPVPVSTNAFDVSSYWDLNGSLMALIANGNQRAFLYSNPRRFMAERGVADGHLLFDGIKDGNSYRGTGRVFTKTCGVVTFPASGPIEQNGRQVVLSGRVPVLGLDCNATAETDITLDFNFVSKSQ